MSRIRPYLRLLRAPAVPTAASNILMGYLVANGSWTPAVPLAILLLASIGIYTAGMVLNDVVDADEDRRLRPHRPIPSGEIKQNTARRIGWSLLSGGVVLSFAAGWIGRFFDTDVVVWKSGAIGMCLGLAVVAYNFWLKKYWFGTIVLGVCRCLNVLLGMSVGMETASQSAFGFTPLQWSIAGGIGVYIVGLSVLARREADEVRRGQIAISLSLMAIAIVWLASLIWRSGDFRLQWLSPDKKSVASSLFVIIFIPVLTRILRAFSSKNAAHVQRAVTSSLFSLVIIDAILCAAVGAGQTLLPILVALLIIPSYVLSRWAYAT